MAAKPTGSTPTVNAAFVPREVCVLTWGDLHRERCNWMTTGPGLVPPGYQDPSAVASCPLRVEETGSNVFQAYGATCRNAGRDGAEVSRGHSRCPGVGALKGQTMRPVSYTHLRAHETGRN